MKKLILSVLLCSLLLSSCGIFGSGTEVVRPPTKELPTYIEDSGEAGKYVGTGIYPAKYEIGNPNGYLRGVTIDLVFELYNGLPFSSPIEVSIPRPSVTTVEKRLEKGLVFWEDCNKYVSILGQESGVEAYGSQEVTVRLLVPKDVDTPEKWFFPVQYCNVGQQWGPYKETTSNNFVFYPSSFELDASDSLQRLKLLTWGNSPRLMVRASYGSPPETINDGRIVYLDTGEQVIRKWDKGDGTLLDRQYTLFDVVDNQQLPLDQETHLFYRAWLENRNPQGEPDGTWSPINQSQFIQKVSAEVQVVMR